MNKIFTVLSAVLISVNLWAQAPQSFSYQAVVRGTDNALVEDPSNVCIVLQKTPPVTVDANVVVISTVAAVPARKTSK